MPLFNKNYLLIAATLYFGFISIAQSQTSSNCPPEPMPLEQQRAYIEQAPAKNAGFLWRIEKDGRTSWLYGTMHQMHIDFAKPGMQVMFGMRSSDVLAPEINIYDPQTPVSTNHTNFMVSQLQLERLKKLYSSDCLTGEANKLFLFPLLTSQAQRQHLSWGYSPDARLMQIAKRSNKPIVQLETLELQFKALNPRSQSEFDAQLEAGLGSIESGEYQRNLLQMAKAWQTNDLEYFSKVEAQISASAPEFIVRLNDERNLGMAQKIDAMHMEGKRVFVAVGALHMTGKHGLPKLMREKGYAVHFVHLKNQ